MWEDITLPCLAQRHRVIQPRGDEMTVLIPSAWGLIEGSDDPKFGTNLMRVFLYAPLEKVKPVTLCLAWHLYIVYLTYVINVDFGRVLPVICHLLMRRCYTTANDRRLSPNIQHIIMLTSLHCGRG